MSGEGFLLSFETAAVFFRYCRRYKIDDRKGRIEVLRRITARRSATYVRDVDEFMKGKKVLRIGKADNRKERGN